MTLCPGIQQNAVIGTTAQYASLSPNAQMLQSHQLQSWSAKHLWTLLEVYKSFLPFANPKPIKFRQDQDDNICYVRELLKGGQ